MHKSIKILMMACFISIASANTITEIIISGNSNISDAAIMKVISSKVGEAMVTDNIIADINEIYNLGYFKDDIGAETITLTANNIQLLFTVNENPVVKQLFFVGLNTFTKEELLASLNIKEGKTLNYADLRHDIKALTDYYHQRGYVLMTLKEIVEPKEDNNLTFVIKEGIVEDIFIKNLTFTKEYVITREMQTKIGAAFNINTIKEDVRSVYNTGFMNGVNIEPPMAGVDPDKVVVVLKIEEKKSGTLQFGGGIGSATGFFGFIQLGFINFLGEGYNISVKGQWGEKQGTYELKYHNPWFFDDKTYLTARLWHTNGQIDEGQGLEAFNSGGEVTMGKPITKEISGFVNYRHDNVDPDDASIPNYRVRSVGLGLDYDTRDFKFNPSSGEYILFNTNSSLKILDATVEYFKYRIRVYKFFPLGEELALGLKGTIDDSFGTIFDTERYFAGGSTTVRGYQDGSPFAIGGRRFLGTVELRYNINKQIQLYGFYDLGKVVKGQSSCTFVGDPSWRSGKGIGLKIQTPIGPLRFDYAWGDGKPYDWNTSTNTNDKIANQAVLHFNIENSF